MAPTSDSGRVAPVRVRLQRVNAGSAIAHPPDGEGKIWWTRLKKALGTSSSAFVNVFLSHLQGAARMPGGGISELAVNSALAVIEAAAPRDEIEGALAVQMACTFRDSTADLALKDGPRSFVRQPLDC